MINENKPQRQNVFLALGALAYELTGPVLCAVTVLNQKALLPGWLEMMYMIFGGMLGLLFLTIYFCLADPGKIKWADKIKNHWADVLKAELWLLTIYYIWIFLRKMLNLLRSSLLSDKIAYIAVFSVLAFAAVLVFSLCLPRLFLACGLHPGKGFVCRLLTFGITALSAGLLTVVPFFWNRLSEIRGYSIVAMLGLHIFLAFCECAAIWLLAAGSEFSRASATAAAANVSSGAGTFAAVSPAAAPSVAIPSAAAPSVAIPSAAAPPVAVSPVTTLPVTVPYVTAPPAVRPPAGGMPVNVRGALEMGIPFVVAVILIFLTGNGFSAGSTAKRVASVIEAPISEGYASLEEGNLEKAVQCFTRAEARIRAFRSLVSEEAGETLRSVYLEYPEDVAIGALFLTASGNYQAAGNLETGIRNYTKGSEWYPVLLRYYREQTKLFKEKEQPADGEALTEEQKQLRKDLLLWCIARERYSEEICVFVQDLEGSKLAVLEQLQDYEEEAAVCSLLRLMAQYGAEGGYSKDLVNQALKMSEEKPDNLLLQYAAYQIGSNYQEDSANHYVRTAEAAARFDSLYDDGTRTEVQLVSEKRKLGDAAMRCYQYEAALTYYEAAYRLSGEAPDALSCAKIYEKTENYAECAMMAARVLTQEPENAQALYLMAVSSLKTGDVDGALSAAGQLGNLVADKSRPADVAEENYLYVCAQYLAMSDSSSWTDYTWRVYDSLSEEQTAKVQSHALLWDYMTAIYQCFMKRNYEEASQAVENILALRDDLPMAWYLKGTIFFDEKELENALEAFNCAVDCGSVAPAVYFSIANVYEAMEDYENAWIYAKRVEEMLPYQDHGNDVYGISVHNKRLLNAVEGKLRR